MKIKTSELTGAALDWVVAKAEEIDYACGISEVGGVLYYAENGEAHRYRPSTDWAEGGPIIEQERVCVVCEFTDGAPHIMTWFAHVYKQDPIEDAVAGPTPLIAAMRCYVQANLGDEVDVPEELLP